MAVDRRPVAELARDVAPQHRTFPTLVSAQVAREEGAIAATPLASPEAATGLWRAVVLPSPGCAHALAPQQPTPPMRVSVQVWPNPAAIAVTPPVRPETATGVWRLFLVPS